MSAATAAPDEKTSIMIQRIRARGLTELGDDHRTPPWLQRFFQGWFDPCPLGIRLFDGLRISWKDPTFVNPPYSNPAPWVMKAIAEAKKGTRVVMLTRVDPSTQWWLNLLASGARVSCFFGRIKFTGGGSPNFASALWFL
jgi:DNA N-6-adenine-methyltransferase (Dam)